MHVPLAERVRKRAVRDRDGAALGVDVGGRLVTVGARYEVGFVSIFSNDDSKNRVLSFLGTVEWPFHSKK